MTISVRKYAGQWLSLMALYACFTVLKSIFSVTGDHLRDMLSERLAYLPGTYPAVQLCTLCRHVGS